MKNADFAIEDGAPSPSKPRAMCHQQPNASGAHSTMFFKAATGFVALFAILFYRSGRILKHNILTVPALPDAYYVGGNWTTHCSVVKDEVSNAINFCEDITFWDHRDEDGRLSNRYILLGCDPNRKAWNTVMGPLRDPAPRGHLWLYSPEDGAVNPITLEGYPAEHDFHPLGMEIYPSRAGAASNLFVVNHARARTTIEMFTIDPARPYQATYVRTLTTPYFVSPNALALTSPTSFYVTNDHLMTRRLPSPLGHILPIIETLAGLPLSWLAHVSLNDDGSLMHTFSALGIPFANGVSISPDGTHLALASTSTGTILFYTRNTTTNALHFDTSVPVPFFPDNIKYDDAGILMVAGHPHFPSLTALSANKTDAISPSWTISLSPVSNNIHFVPGIDPTTRGYDLRAPLSASKIAPATITHDVETVFQSDGSVFGSSSTVLRDSESGKIYVAGLYEAGIMVCRP